MRARAALASLMSAIPIDDIEDEPLMLDEKIAEAVNVALAGMGFGLLADGEGASTGIIGATDIQRGSDEKSIIIENNIFRASKRKIW